MTELRNLKCPLSKDQVRARGRTMAELIRDAEVLRDEKKAQAASIKARIESVEHEVAALASEVRDAVEDGMEVGA